MAYRAVTLTLALLAVGGSCSVEIDKASLENILIRNDQNDDVMKVLSLSTSPSVENLTTLGSSDLRITMDVLLKNGDKTKRSVILKELPKTPALHKQIEESGIFKQEILVYKDALEMMEREMNELNDRSEPLWIRALDLREYDRLILEDAIQELGYVMADRWKGMDSSQSALAVISLAKFHALSAVTNEKHPFENLIKESLVEKNYDGIKDFYTVVYQNFAKAIETNWGPEWAYAAKKIREIAPTVKERMRNLYTQRPMPTFSCLNIGAPNIRNIFFKYNISDIYLPTNAPIAVRFSYFQIAFFNSPVHDLQYLLNTSPNLRVMLHERDQLLQLYFTTLTKYLKKFNYNGYQWKLNEFLDEMKRTDFEGITIALQILPVVLEIPKAEDNSEHYAIENSKSDTAVLDTSGMYSKEYETIMKALLKRAFDNHVL